MVNKRDMAKLRDELVDAFEWAEEERASALVSQLAEHPRQAHALLDEMLASPDAGVRRAAVFGLGKLGGRANLKRLEQQMEIEERRGDHDGASVLEVITEALGRIQDADARAGLIRRLKRVIAGKQPASSASDVAYALWRKRHPELIPVIRSALEQLPSTNDAWALRALLRLLETPPAALATWAMDPAVPPALKADVMAILDEEVPDELLPVIPVFISGANALEDVAVRQESGAAEFCNRLFTMLLLHRARILPRLPVEAISELRALARRCVAACVPNCSTRAVWMLEQIGRPEDASLIEANCPADPGLAEDYSDIARMLRLRS